MKMLNRIAALVILSALAGQAQAALLKTWNLLNKAPGALGYDYGLRLNNMQGTVGGSGIMIFDFADPGNVTLELHSVAADDANLDDDFEMRLAGTAFGARYENGVGYSGAFAGDYDLAFTWQDVQSDIGGWDYVAEWNLGTHTIGDGTGLVTGVDVGTVGSIALADYSGTFGYTLDVDFGRANPNASAWLSIDGGHDGDFGFSMLETTPVNNVPAPGVLAVFGLGLFAMGVRRKRRS